jgi:hypothetical protein
MSVLALERETQRRRRGLAFFALRDLKAGEEIVLGQWECSAYVTCAAEHSAYVSVSFSILFNYLPWIYRLYSTPSSPTASPPTK